MRTCVAVLFLSYSLACLAQGPAAYPESEAAAAWRGLAAGYVRKALRDGTLNRDPVLNARADAVIARVGAAAAHADPRFAGVTWKAILIEDFGHGAAAFPGEIILVDAKFMRALRLDDDELALILSHEVAHVLAGHALAKLSFMAEFLGKEKLPTARTALLEFLARDSYAEVFQPRALLQEREADRAGAAIFFAAGYDAPRALKLFDKLAELESSEERRGRRLTDSHDPAAARRQAIARVIAELRQRQERGLTAGP